MRHYIKPTLKLYAAAAILITLTACSSGGGSRAQLSATTALAKAPVVSSGTQIRKYANLFRRACLDQASDYSKTITTFKSAGFQPIGSSNDTLNGTLSDGTAFAQLSTPKGAFASCSVAIKTPDDDPLVAELKRVVAGSKFRTAKYSAGGILGAGFNVANGRSISQAITVSRSKRSIQSPTSFRILDSGN